MLDSHHKYVWLIMSSPFYSEKIVACSFSFILFLSSALLRFHLKQQLILNHQVIREGVPRPGKQDYLNAIYVPPQISTQCCGGVDPSHELRAHLSSPFQIPSEDTFVDLNNLFRLKKTDGQPVRTVITTGIPGIGMTVSVGKFCLDWAELCANKVRTHFQQQRVW